MDKKMKLSEHFTLGEFLHEGVEHLPKEIISNLKMLCAKLEEVRKTLGNKPMIITSGYRSPEHNRRVGGARASYHLRGMAADFVVPGMSPQRVQSLLDDDWNGGLEYAPSWTHLDLGPKRRFRP